MIRFTRVAKTYASGVPAIEDVSFHLTRGEFAFLTGPSGAGKSTVLKLCYVEERPNSGEVRLLGQSSVLLTPRKVPALRRRLGIVFQDFRLLPDRTAAENVAFALEVTGAAPSAIGPKVLRVLDQVGLKAKAGSRPHELSGGEQQRVAIARALVNDPLLILADEPTGNLDERSTRGVFELLQQINAGGTTVLMATHDLRLVRESGCRTLEMQRGRLVFDSGAARAAGATPATGTEDLA